MKMLEIDGHVEIHMEEPFVESPEQVPGHGRSYRGYVKFRNGDGFSVENEPEDAQLCFPVWIGETQGMFVDGESAEYYARCAAGTRPCEDADVAETAGEGPETPAETLVM